MSNGIGDLLRSIEERDRIWIPCPFRTILGVRCPGCGMTHALVAMLRGDLKAAIRYNPFVLALIPLMLAGIVDVIGRFSHVARIVKEEINSLE